MTQKLWHFIIVISLFFPALLSADWEDTLQANFDIVDTFDARDDWRPTNSPSCSWSEYQTNVPGDPNDTGLDWGSYSWKSSIIEADREWYIDDHGIGKQMGTKALQLGGEGDDPDDSCFPSPITYTGHVSSGTFKGYFGSPTATDGSTGYTDAYFFFRYYFPLNSYPTDGEDLANEVVKYVEGNDFMNSNGPGLKRFSLGVGFCGVFSYWDPVTEGCVPAETDYRYGDSENWVYLRTVGDEGSRTLSGSLENRLYSLFNNTSFDDSNAWETIADQLGGIEIHMKLASDEFVGDDPSGACVGCDGVFEVWFYDADGNVINSGDPVVSLTDCVFREHVDQKINRVWIHSNFRVGADYENWTSEITFLEQEVTRHDSIFYVAKQENTNQEPPNATYWTVFDDAADFYYKCGEGMDCVEYIDDVIIDEARIGETYFELLNGESTPGRATLGAGQPANLEAGVLVNILP